jgi:hypothetical protein
MYDRPPDDDGSGASVLRRAVDIALTVAAQTEWLAGRPMIVPIVAPGLDVPGHIRIVAANANRLADQLCGTLTSDLLVQHHNSDVVDIVSDVAMTCRLFADQWSSTPDADADRFNDDVLYLRQHVDRKIRSLTPA